MSATEDRIVRMKFDNASFKKGATETKTSLDQIDAGIAKAGKSKGLMDMAGHMETVKVKAGAMQVAAVTAISNIANRAVNAGIQIAKSFTLDPIKQGFQEYELKMKSIQTILANTEGENLKSVSAALNELNTYSDKTIYNFANMTENIGKLTTAGIGLKDSTAVVKGFHNMVALAGGDATAAAGAMEQFGQGLQAGTIKAMDWMSISNRGLGSQSLQKAFFETARAVGSLKDVPLETTFEDWAKANGGFKASLEEGWLTTDVATKALSAVTGDVKNVEELMKQGFSRQAATDLLEIADNAVESATKVRTFSAFMDTTKEALASGWGQVMEVIFGDFNESTKLFTKLSEITGKYIKMFFGYVSRLIEAFDAMGGRTAVLETIKNLLSPILAILGLLAKVWKTIFGGGDSGKGLATFAKALQHVTRPLRIFSKLISGQLTPMEAFERLVEVVRHALRNLANYLGGGLADKLKNLFNFKVSGGGAVADFAKEAISWIEKLIHKIGDLTGSVPNIGGALDKLKDFEFPSFGGSDEVSKVKSFTDSIMTSGDKIEAFEEKRKALGLSSPMDALQEESDGLRFNPDADISAGRINDIPAGGVGGALGSTSDAAVEDAKSAGAKLIEILDSIKNKFLDFVKNASFDDLIASFNIAVLSVFFIRMSQMMKTFTDSAKGISGTFASISDALGSFQTSAKAKLITAIAIAIGILAVSLWLLSTIPKDKLFTALAAMAGLGFILKKSLDAFVETVEKLDGKGINLKMVTLGVSMVLLAISISILASAMKKMTEVDWNAVLKAGIAIGLLTTAMQLLGKIDNPNILKTAFAMVVVSAALMLFAIAIKKFAGLDFATFAEGIAYAALALGVLAGTMRGFESSFTGALALVVVVGALWLLEKVIRKYAELDWGAFAHGMGMVTLALMGLVFALHGFQTSLAGAAAMAVVIVSLYALFEIIGMFAEIEWSTFAKGMGMVVIALLALGGALMLLGLGAGLIAAAAGALLIFAAAVALIGVGVVALAAGLGALIALGAGLGVAITAFFTSLAIGFAVFLTTLAAEAPIIKKAILDMLQVIIDTIVEAVPMIIDGIKRLWKAIMAELGGGGEGGGKPQALMGKTSQSWMDKLKEGIKKKIPELVKGAKDLLMRFIDGLVKHSKSIGQKGVDLVTGLIDGIASRVGGIVESATNLIIKFAEGISNNLPRLAKAGIQLMADYLHALADAIRSGAAAIGGGLSDVIDAMRDVGVDCVKGLIAGIGDMAGDALNAIGDLASDMIGKAKDMFKVFSPSRVFKAIGTFLVEGLTQGIQENAASAVTAVASMVSGQIAVANEYVSEFIQKLDQQAIKATAKAAGLASAAEKAAAQADKSASAADKQAAKAEKTKKNKKDDKAAKRAQRQAEKAAERAEDISDKADKATKRAEKKEERLQKAKDAQDRAEQFVDSTLLEKAVMRSEDAQTQMDAAKAAEQKAAANLVEADALDAAAKGPGLSKQQKKEMRAEADRLRAQAKEQAKEANAQIRLARASAKDALELQRQAGDEAAASYQAEYDQEAQADAEDEAFEKLTNTEKAQKRRDQAAALQKKADADLIAAKALAYTDIEAANELAQQAMEQAEQAREYMKDAEDYDTAAIAGTGASAGQSGGTVVNLDPTEAASVAFGNYSDLYDQGMAAAAGTSTVEFNQYNTSPEALNPTDVYRNTNNQLSFAATKLPTAA